MNELTDKNFDAFIRSSDKPVVGRLGAVPVRSLLQSLKKLPVSMRSIFLLAP